MSNKYNFIRILVYVLFHIPYIILLIQEKEFLNNILYRYLEIVSICCFLIFIFFYEKSTKKYDTEYRLFRSIKVLNLERFFIGLVFIFSTMERYIEGINYITFSYLLCISVYYLLKLRIKIG